MPPPARPLPEAANDWAAEAAGDSAAAAAAARAAMLRLVACNWAWLPEVGMELTIEVAVAAAVAELLASFATIRLSCKNTTIH